MPKEPIPGYPRTHKDPRNDPSVPPEDGGRPSRVEIEDFNKAVHVRYGKLSFGVPLTIFGALLGGGGMAAYHHQVYTSPDGPNAEAIHAIAELSQKVDKNKTDTDNQLALILQRVNSLDTKDGVKEVQLAAVLAQLRAR